MNPLDGVAKDMAPKDAVWRCLIVVFCSVRWGLLVGSADVPVFAGCTLQALAPVPRVQMRGGAVVLVEDQYSADLCVVHCEGTWVLVGGERRSRVWSGV